MSLHRPPVSVCRKCVYFFAFIYYKSNDFNNCYSYHWILLIPSIPSIPSISSITSISWIYLQYLQYTLFCVIELQIKSSKKAFRWKVVSEKFMWESLVILNSKLKKIFIINLFTLTLKRNTFWYLNF